MITKNSKIWKYISNLFLSIDQLGNAIAGGNPDNTISARVGYYNHHYYISKKDVPWYWSLFEKIIDATFLPVDGKDHCHEAYHNDAGEIFDNRVTDVLITIAAVIIIISCIPIALILYLSSAIRIVKRKKIERDDNLRKRFFSSTSQLISSLQEIEEHGLDFDLQKPKQELKILIEKVEDLKEKFKIS
ncbi:hypothetical protein KCTC32516_00563 [Polaribacter huanghezhanensis]|uniref:hypothetical protein n=1 Tax=Polaribacter huanghezhanensis TaxID=1354726 RepID=UPI00264947C4|nr:hypothetical protein [Polaribacter huanghezhanensis]WKD85223.1 hypothetical protein KCTC32516_00563 [Polaribacter huanghezhanensis]